MAMRCERVMSPTLRGENRVGLGVGVGVLMTATVAVVNGVVGGCGGSVKCE